MRAGSHPWKKVSKMALPKDITVQMVTFIPFLDGYFEQSLDVLKFSLESLRQNTPLPYDLMIFDNGSCPEVRAYLVGEQAQGRIQYLLLSSENVGFPGAWNALFRAAPGKIIAYSDSDIYFRSGWLEACLRLLETYPKVGMVTGIPLRNPPHLNSQTVAWAQATEGVTLRQGNLMPWEIFWAHARSTGYEEETARQRHTALEAPDTYLEYQGVPAAVGAGHFQFVSPRAALNEMAPFPLEIPMGNERYLDDQINQKGYLRLCTQEMVVQHIGNRLDRSLFANTDGPSTNGPSTNENTNTRMAHTNKSSNTRIGRRFFNFPVVRKLLMYIYHRIFRIYYE